MLKKITVRRVLFAVFTLLTVLWMCAIFGFSSKTAEESTVQSNFVTELLLKVFESDFNDLTKAEQEEIIEVYDGIVRKAAHFAAYALLGFLAYLSVGSFRYLPDRKFVPAMASVPGCIIFSISDEYHQTFVDGRSGQLSDVCTDSLGAVFGTLCAIFAVYVFFRYILKAKRV